MSRTLNRHHAHVVWPGDVADEHILDACARAYRIGMEDLLASFAVDHGVVGRHAQEFGKQVFIEGVDAQDVCRDVCKDCHDGDGEQRVERPRELKDEHHGGHGGPHNA